MRVGITQGCRTEELLRYYPPHASGDCPTKHDSAMASAVGSPHASGDAPYLVGTNPIALLVSPFIWG